MNREILAMAATEYVGITCLILAVLLAGATDSIRPHLGALRQWAVARCLPRQLRQDLAPAHGTPVASAPATTTRNVPTNL